MSDGQANEPAFVESVTGDVTPGMYEEFEDRANDILAFELVEGLGVKVKTNVYPRVGLQASLSFPVAPALGLSYCSSPQAQLRFKRDLSETVSSITDPPPLPSYIPEKSYYVSGLLDPLRTLHFDYMHRFTKHLTWKLYGVTTLFEKQNTDACLKIQYDTPSYNVQAKAATDNQYFGLSGLWRFYLWSIGGEFFFSNTQRNAGLSAGFQYFNKISPYRTQWTNTVNTMGDLTTTFTSAIIPSTLTASARYSFNTNSHESELSAGLAYTPPNIPILVRARLDNTLNWSIAATVQRRVGKLDLTCSVGVGGGGGSMSETKGESRLRYGCALSIDI